MAIGGAGCGAHGVALYDPAPARQVSHVYPNAVTVGRGNDSSRVAISRWQAMTGMAGAFSRPKTAEKEPTPTPRIA
jgi:hypothetical protein